MTGTITSSGGIAGTGRFAVSSSISKTGESKDMKLERIINKFRAGKKLTSGELSYLAKKDPATYQKVLRIMQRREQLEERLEAAKTKEEAQMIMMQEMQSIENFCNNSDDDFEKTAMVNQMMEAYSETTKSEAYQNKPDTNAELAELKQEKKYGQEETEKLQRRQKRKKKKIRNRVDFQDSDEESDSGGEDDSMLIREDIPSLGEYQPPPETSMEYDEYSEYNGASENVTYTPQATKRKSSEAEAIRGGRVDVAI